MLKPSDIITRRKVFATERPPAPLLARTAAYACANWRDVDRSNNSVVALTYRRVPRESADGRTPESDKHPRECLYTIGSIDRYG